MRTSSTVLALMAVLVGCTRTPPGPEAYGLASPSPPAMTAGTAGQAAAPAPALARITARTYAPAPLDELKARLTPLQFEVTQHGATEPPFQNAYFNNHAAGLYVDVATGEPLFSSRDKFESGTGWPSFTRPVEAGRVVEHEDSTFGMVRTEVLSAGGHSHLGHVFPDGPEPTGLRYCIDSAALRFIPVDRLVAEGYGAYAPAFGVATANDSPPPATSNSCALPPPGTTPGCSATLEVAIFARQGDDGRVHLPDGVLEVTPGAEGASPAVEITFDPGKLAYGDLLAAWTKGREKGTTVYARTDDQKRAASARNLRVSDAVPFARQ